VATSATQVLAEETFRVLGENSHESKIAIPIARIGAHLFLESLLVQATEPELYPGVDEEQREESAIHVEPLHILGNHKVAGLAKLVAAMELEEQPVEAALPGSFIMGVTHCFVPVRHEVQQVAKCRPRATTFPVEHG
jgi:hypothetical protein